MSLAGELLRALDATDADGERQFSEDDVRHYLPLFVLRMVESAPAAPLPRPIVELMQQFFERIEVPAGASVEQLQARVKAHYAAHPPNRHLVAALERAFRDDAASGAERDTDGVAAFLGMKSSKVPLGARGPAPEGAIAAGPLARFRLGK